MPPDDDLIGPDDRLIRASVPPVNPRAAGAASPLNIVDDETAAWLTAEIEAKIKEFSNVIAWEDLAIGKRIGVGAFSEVFAGRWNGQEVAIKKLFDQNPTQENLEEFRLEVEIMAQLDHPNTTKFFGVCPKPPHLCIVTELLQMSLFDFLVRFHFRFSRFNRVVW